MTILRFEPYSTEPEVLQADALKGYAKGLSPTDPPDAYDRALCHAVPLWQRCAPWTTLVLVRSFETLTSACYSAQNETIYLACIRSDGSLVYPHYLVSAMHHEIAHAVAHMHPEWEAAVFSELAPIQYGDAYSDRPCERVARVYEYHACMADETGLMPPAVVDFAMIYNGDLARRIAAY